MAEVSPLSSIRVESANEDAPVLPADPPKHHSGPQLWSGFWNLLILVHLYWDLLSLIPLDIYLASIFASRVDSPESISMDDRLDLHSTLPLLVVSTKNSPNFCVYNTETSEFITYWVKMPRDTRNGRAIADSRITCLKFSKGNHLAVGLSDGTVRLIEQDFASMIESPPTAERAKQPNSERVTLLPLDNSRVSADFAGSVTNIAFSPSTDCMPGDWIWVAIATEKAGIWIWSQRMREAIRVVSTAGINEGCLHWVSVLEEQKLKSASRKRRPVSTWRRRSGFLDDVSLMDKGFAPSPETKDVPIDLKWSAPLHACSSEPIKDTHIGESFLVFGTKDGRLGIQRLWHSSSMMILETSIEFSPTACVQSDSLLAHRFGPASGEITHLVMQSPVVTTSEAKLTIFMSSKNDADASIPVHRFSVSMPLKEPVKVWWNWVPAFGAGILRPLVNFFLAGTDYRWLSRQTWPSACDHTLVRNDDGQDTALTSASALANTPFLLTTSGAKPSRGATRATDSECILRCHDASVPGLADHILIKPFLSIPSPPSPPPPAHPHGYYTALKIQAGLMNPTPKRRRAPEGRYATHAYDCGRVAWGQQKCGEAVGGFLYQPASAHDPSRAVGLFKIRY